MEEYDEVDDNCEGMTACHENSLLVGNQPVCLPCRVRHTWLTMTHWNSDRNGTERQALSRDIEVPLGAGSSFRRQRASLVATTKVSADELMRRAGAVKRSAATHYPALMLTFG